MTILLEELLREGKKKKRDFYAFPLFFMGFTA
jgi:hypothetical protein